MTKFLNISTDNTLGGNAPSDEIVSSQKAIKTALDAKVINNSTITIKQGGTTKGSFTLNQATDSTIELDAGGGGAVDSVNGQTGVVVLTASDVGAQPTITGAATTITRNNLSAARALVSSSTGKVAVSTVTSTELGYLHGVTSAVQTQLNNKVNSSALATVATSGSYNDLNDKPTIPTVNNATITITQGGVTKGSFTLNQATGDTIALDAGGGSDSSYHPDLFDHKWADHVLNDASWLRADTFSWQSGAVYQAAYQHLADDYTNANYIIADNVTYFRYAAGDTGSVYCWKSQSDVTRFTKSETPVVGGLAYHSSALPAAGDEITDVKLADTETIAGIKITYYQAPDGHKLVLPNQESNVTAIYNATGVAWYYILDTVNQRFKLPRTKFGFTGIRSGVGNYVEAGLPNLTGNAYSNGNDFVGTTTTGVFSGTTHRNGYGIGTTNVPYGNFANPLNFNASLSNSIYGNSDTVQPKATEMYLYFYVGNFTQTALENTAGLNAELFNGKVDTGHQVIEFQEPTSANGYTWYRKYADGWVEQGGFFVRPDSGGGFMTVNLPVTMTDAHYTVLTTIKNEENNSVSFYIKAGNLTTTSFQVKTGYSSDAYRYDFWWQVSGMAA